MVDIPAISSSVFSHETSSAVSSLKTLKRSRIVPLPTAASDEACCICLNLYGPSHKAVTVLIKDCYHRFGQGCLDAYLNSDSPRSNTCPQCRREWYKRRSVATTTRFTTAMEALTVASLPQAPVQVESRTRSRRAQRMLEHDHNLNHEMIAAHLDEVFRRLDLVQDISNERTTITADTRVRLQAVERRARRIHQALQTAYDAVTPAMAGPTSRGHEMRQQPETMSQSDTMSQRGWMEAFAVNLGNDNHSIANESDRISTTAQDGNATRDESYTSSGVSYPNELNIHPLLRSRLWGETNQAWGASVQPMERYYDAGVSLGMFSRALAADSTRRETSADFESDPRPSIAPSPRVSVTACTHTASETNSGSSNYTSPQNFSHEPSNLAHNLVECGSYLPRQPVMESNVPQQNHTAGLPSTADQRPRPLEDRQVSFTIRPDNHVIRTPAVAPPRLPQRRSSLGNLLDRPTLHSTPAANSRPSMSGLERRRSIRDSRQNSASQGWRESLPRRFPSLANLKGSLLSKRGVRDGAVLERSG